MVTGTAVDRSMFLGVSHAPSQGGGAQHPSHFWEFVHGCMQHEKQQSNFAWWSNRCEENFYRVDNAAYPGQNFWWRECWWSIYLQSLTFIC